MQIKPKHQRFALRWMEIQNATQAYRDIYSTDKKVPSDQSCKINGCALLKKKVIKEYIEQKQKELETSSIMNIREIQESLTSIARDGSTPKPTKLRAIDQLTKILGGYQTHITTENRNLNGEMDHFSDEDLDKLLEQTRPGYFDDED